MKTCTRRALLWSTSILLILPLSMKADGIPIAKDFQESKAQLNTRIDMVLEDTLRSPLGPYPTNPNERGRFTNPALARAMAAVDMDEVNRILLDDQTTQWAKYGSTVDIGGICVRDGDYDFTAQALIRVIYPYRHDSSMIWPETMTKIMTKLLPSGNDHYTRQNLGICGVHDDTENHVLMTETSRYLNNQLLMDHPKFAKDLYNNEKNGFNDWILRHLQHLFIEWYSEYNSKPYATYTIQPIVNLYSYADDPRVKAAAGLILDATAAHFAVQSNGGRRNVPFRRQPGYEGRTRLWQGDGEMTRYALLVGNPNFLQAAQRPFLKTVKAQGGDGGQPFDDRSNLSEFPLIETISIRAGGRLDAIETIYRDGLNISYATNYQPKRGGRGGSRQSLVLEQGEFLKTMEWHTGKEKSKRVFYLKLTTSQGRILEGGQPTQTMHKIEAPSGWKIIGFHGRAGKEIDRLGAYLSPIDWDFVPSTLKKNYSIFNRFEMLAAASSPYRVPDLILDLMMDKDQPYFQRVHHRNVEIHSSTKDFLITGGGVFDHYFMYGSREQHGWARPITIIPTKDSSADYKMWIRIYGNERRMRRYNHGIYKNFAAGPNVVIPSHIPQSCREQVGAWHFINFASVACPRDYGFYVAAHIKDCDSSLCKKQGQNFGFFEARAANEISYQVFKQLILKENSKQSYRSDQHNFYRKSDGELLEFVPIPTKKWQWAIVSVDGKEVERDINKWPLFDGDIIRSKKGVITVKNPKMNQVMTLDFSNHLAPQRSIQPDIN